MYNNRPGERPHSRRFDPRQYSPKPVRRKRRSNPTPPPDVARLRDAGSTASSFRSALREKGIDPKLARLVLLFYGTARLRPSEIAWRLAISPSTASRWLDRAERTGLIDKFYNDLSDRRATSAQLTRKGYALRNEVAAILEMCAPFQRPSGYGYGRRASIEYGWSAE